MVRFEPLTASQYESYLEQAVQDYAAENVRSGRWTADEAPEESRAEYARLLPEGLDTVDHYLLSILDTSDGQRVGLIWYWLDRRRNRVFIYDLQIDEAHRRQGYAAQAMRLLEEEGLQLGADRVALHVFAHNHAARALYEKLGYEATNIMMAKLLTAEE